MTQSESPPYKPRTFYGRPRLLRASILTLALSSLMLQGVKAEQLQAEVTAKIRWASDQRLDDAALLVRFTRVQNDSLQPLSPKEVITTVPSSKVRLPYGRYLVHVLLEDGLELWSDLIYVDQPSLFLPIGISIHHRFGFPKSGGSRATIEGRIANAQSGERYWLKLVPIWRNEEFIDLLATDQHEFRFDSIRLGSYLLIAIRCRDNAVMASRAVDVTSDRAIIKVDLDVGDGMAKATPALAP